MIAKNLKVMGLGLAILGSTALSAVAQDFIFLTSFFLVMLWAAVKVTKPKLG